MWHFFLYYSEGCCAAFYLQFDFIFPVTRGESSKPWVILTAVCFDRHFSSFKVNCADNCMFCVDTHACSSWRIFSCSGATCLSVTVVQLCAGGAHSPLIDLSSGRGCPRTVADRPSSMSGERLILSTETGRKMIHQMGQGADFPLLSSDYCVLWRTLSFDQESL